MTTRATRQNPLLTSRDAPGRYAAYFAVRDGSTDTAAALAAADTAAVAAKKPLLLLPGVHRVSSNLTIASTVDFSPGAILLPANGVTITLAGGVYGACRTQLFDHSLGGLVVPRLTEYHPAWWGAVGTADDSQAWKDMAAAVAAHAAAAQLYAGANFGVRVVAPFQVNRILGVELACCEIDAGRGTAGFVPPAGTTSGVILTLGNYAQLNGGYLGTNEDTQAVTCLYLKGYRAQADRVYVANLAANSKAVQMGSTAQATTSPVLTNARIIGLATPGAGTIGIDLQSPDAMVSDTYSAQQDIGFKAQRGFCRITNLHIWGNNTGLSGDSWDGSQICNLYLDSNRGWGADVTNMDRAYWFNITVWNNGHAIPGTGGIALRRPSGSAQFSKLLGVFLNDNVGTGILVDGPTDYEIDCVVSSSKVQSSQPVVTTTGIQITSATTRLRLRVQGTDGATTVLTDSSTTTIYDDTHLSPNKTTPVDADEVPLHDSVVGFRRNRLTWANIKATLKTYFDTLNTTLQNKTLDTTNTVQVLDSLFRLSDTADPTKRAFLNVPPGQTAGATRTHTLPAVDSTLASTADITTAINNLVNAAPGALDTLKELSDALGGDAAFATTVTNALALKAPLASPTFTGTPTLPAGTKGLPYDISYVQTVTTRAVGLGSNPIGIRISRAMQVASVAYRCVDADASGNLVVELRKNGVQIATSVATIAAASQTSATVVNSVNTAFAAGDILTVYITGVGTTPGTGLYADIAAVTT